MFCGLIKILYLPGRFWYTYADSSCPWPQGEGCEGGLAFCWPSAMRVGGQTQEPMLPACWVTLGKSFLPGSSKVPRYVVGSWSACCLPSSPVAWSREGKNLRRSSEPLTGPLLVPPQCCPVRVAPHNSPLAPLGPEVVLHSLDCRLEPPALPLSGCATLSSSLCLSGP